MEPLIEVRSKPVLWDSSLEIYRDSLLKDKGALKIALAEMSETHHCCCCLIHQTTVKPHDTCVGDNIIMAIGGKRGPAAVTVAAAVCGRACGWLEK